MDSYEQLAAAFHRRIECIASAVDDMAPGLEQAASTIVSAVMNDRKLVVCACGSDRSLAEHIASVFRSPDSAPPLPAMAVAADGDVNAIDGLWRDLRALTRDGDVLLVLDTSADSSLALQCTGFAQERNLTSVAITAYQEAINSVCIPLQNQDRSLRIELLMMAAHCLRDQIGQTLLGE